MWIYSNGIEQYVKGVIMRIDPERKYFKPHRVTWRQGNIYDKCLDNLNFGKEMMNFSKSKDGIIVLDDNWQFWRKSKMEYQDELRPRDLGANAPPRKKLKAGYVPSKRFFDWGRNPKHEKKIDAHYLTPLALIPKRYNYQIYLTDKGDQLLSLYDFLERVGRRWIQLKNTNEVLAKDYPITEIMNDEM